MSRAELERRLEGSGIALIRRVTDGVIRTKDEYIRLLETDSIYHDGKLEGADCLSYDANGKSPW